MKSSRLASKCWGSGLLLFRVVSALILLLVLASARASAQKTTRPIVLPKTPDIDTTDVWTLHYLDYGTVPGGDARKQALIASQRDSCLLPPLDLTNSDVVPATQLQIPPKARKEYQDACSALIKKKLPEAEKHLRKAVREYGNYGAAWVTLGQVLTSLQQIDDARSACLQASTANPTYLPAYLCLADIARRAHNWDEELKLSTRALGIDPSNDFVAYEFHAVASANLQNFDQAEKSALRAIEIDKDHREPLLYFILAQIYEMKGDSKREAEQLQVYMRYTKSPEGIALARRMRSKLENGSGKALEDSSNTDSRPVVEPAAQRWAPPDVDAVPPVLDEGNCPLPSILRETSNHTQELIENLERFSATDRIQQIDVDKYGRKRNSGTQVVGYVAQIEQKSSPFPVIQEFRSGAGVRQGAMVDSGTAGFALIFHPSHVGNLSFRCEGRTELHGLAAWQLRFEESADPDKAFTGFRMNGSAYAPRLKGRVWIATDSYNVVRIETDLVAPIREIDLQLEHLVISYAPVEFPANHIRVWLPESASLYVAYRGHRYQREHSFSQFQLFSVEATETVKEPGGLKDQPAR